MTENTANEFQRMIELANRNRMWIKLKEAKIYYEMQSDGSVRYCLNIVRTLNGRWCECILAMVKVMSMVTNERITMCVADDRTIIIC